MAMVKAWTIRHDVYGLGPTDTLARNVTDFIEAEKGEDTDGEYADVSVPTADDFEAMAIGDERRFGPLLVTCCEIDPAELDKMPEWDGW